MPAITGLAGAGVLPTSCARSRVSPLDPDPLAKAGAVENAVIARATTAVVERTRLV
jgi:hypothetical protein